MKPTKVTSGGKSKIIDANEFSDNPDCGRTGHGEAGGLRELHWHPNADEWQLLH